MDDGIWRQAIPDVEELEQNVDLLVDPLDEEEIYHWVAQGQ